MCVLNFRCVKKDLVYRGGEESFVKVKYSRFINFSLTLDSFGSQSIHELFTSN